MGFVIAELSGNHGGDLAKALEMIRVAKRCGCGAAKIQTYRPEDMHDPDNNHIYEKYAIPEHWFGPLFEQARKSGINLFSSVFAPWAVAFLENFKPIAYKIASPSSTKLPDYAPLVDAIKASAAEFWISANDHYLPWAQSLRADEVFYCVDGYPAPHLTWEQFAHVSGITGFSDHTKGINDALAMRQLGVFYIEKHFKLDDDCIDAAFAIGPDEMKVLCKLA